MRYEGRIEILLIQIEGWDCSRRDHMSDLLREEIIHRLEPKRCKQNHQ